MFRLCRKLLCATLWLKAMCVPRASARMVAKHPTPRSSAYVLLARLRRSPMTTAEQIFRALQQTIQLFAEGQQQVSHMLNAGIATSAGRRARPAPETSRNRTTSMGATPSDIIYPRR